MAKPPPSGLMLHLSYYAPHVSGLTVSAAELARCFVARGHAVTVATSRQPGQAAEEVIDGVRVFRSRAVAIIGKAPVMPLQAREIWRAMDSAAVVSLQLPCADAGLAAVIARLRRRRVIVTYHCGLSRDGWRVRVQRALLAIPHLMAGLLADRIQVVSQDYAAQSAFCRLFRHKLHFAPPPMPLPHLPRRMARTDPSAPLRIGFVGRIARQKNIGLLLAAFDGLSAMVGRKVELHLAGPPEGDGTPLAAAGNPLIHWHGVLAQPDLHAFYARLDLFVLPSIDRQESFGIVQVEAMLAGVPVIACDLPGIREPLRQTGMGRLVPPGDAAAMRRAMAEVLTGLPIPALPPEALENLFGPSVTCATYLTHPALCGPTKQAALR